MRSLRDWIAEAPTAAIAAALATLVIGAGLCGFALAELTRGDDDEQAAVTQEQRAVAPEAPAVVGGGKQKERQPPRRRARERILTAFPMERRREGILRVVEDALDG